ncbi:MAG: 23S rRNA (adenine(2503)-C(2))-methyltransferase RlmN [Phycisphaerales bacterium]
MTPNECESDTIPPPLHGSIDQPIDPLGLTLDRFVAACAPRLSRGAAIQAYRRTFRDGAPEPRPGIRVALAPVARVLREPSDEGEVVKFTQTIRATPDVGAPNSSSAAGAPNTLETESVLIPMIGRTGSKTHTLCVSSQVGCAMGCTFCETAQMGLIRSLSAGEIVGQWFAAAHTLGMTPRNIVFMGMGEPMDNLDEVIRAIAVLTDQNGPAHPMNKITVSTVGRLDGIRRLAEQVHRPGWHRLNLAVSLNAPNDDVRSRIMPVNRAMPMADLRDALLAWPIYGGAKICIEYVLIPGVNDAPEHAREVADWVRPLPACVNLIPYNPRRNSPWPAPEEDRVAEFLGWLLDAGAYAKRRRTKGRAMMGACGQLGSERIRKRRFVEPSVSR